MGRAVLKVNGARIHILTWPSKFHFQCDLQRGMHTLYTAFICRDLILVWIMLSSNWKKNFAGFYVILVPKLLAFLATFVTALYNNSHRQDLLDWIAGKQLQQDLTESQRLALDQVSAYHFHGEKREDYKFYQHLAPTDSRFPLMPQIALGLVCFVGISLAVCNAVMEDAGCPPS